MGTDPSAVTSSAGYLLMKAGMHATRAIESALDEVGLSAREFLVLTYVGGEAMSQQELSRRLGIDPTLVVALVDGLESRGLLSRARDPDDRRRYALSLTAAGKRLRKRATDATAAAEDALLRAVPAADRRTLRDLLRRVISPS